MGDFVDEVFGTHTSRGGGQYGDGDGGDRAPAVARSRVGGGDRQGGNCEHALHCCCIDELSPVRASGCIFTVSVPVSKSCSDAFSPCRYQ